MCACSPASIFLFASSKLLPRTASLYQRRTGEVGTLARCPISDAALGRNPSRMGDATPGTLRKLADCYFFDNSSSK
jgi:hypothetical protein